MKGPNLNPFANFGQRYMPSSEEDEEFRMTVGDMTKKRAFGIFQDVPEISPGRTESSLEDHRYAADHTPPLAAVADISLGRFDFSGDRMTSRPTDMKASNYISPTPAAKQPASRGAGKERPKSGMSPQVHVHQTFSTPASHIYPGQIFYDPSINPLYNQAWARTFPYAAPQMGFTQDARPPPRFHTSLHGEFRSIHPATRPSSQHGAGPSNNTNTPHGMHYGV